MISKNELYNILVNRHPGISSRYHKFHDGLTGMHKVFSWLYLLWLNFAYYILQCRFLGKIPQMEIYEEKRLNCKKSESEAYLQSHPELSVDTFAEQLSQYDVISFDVFDTLIFRPLSLPTDVFYLIGQELGIMDFRNIRIWAEWDARVKYNEKEGNMEIGLADIWDNLEEDVGIASNQGQELEMAFEQKLCYANPFMLAVWRALKERKKKIIIVSDMYLPEKCIRRILESAGFTGAEKIYISSEYHKSKADGKLYREVLQDWHRDVDDKKQLSIVHVGDNPHSDQKQAVRAGMDVYPYQNVNKNVLLYRAFDMSPLIGSAYRAIISNWLYAGVTEHSMEYEFGFIYGGLFVLGYCGFIHDYCVKNKINKLLFLSRDGDTLKQAYDYLYPEENTEYVYWSRKAAVKLEAVYDKHDYFRRFIYHKMNQDYTIHEVLHSMELDFLEERLPEWKNIWTEKAKEQERASKALAYKQLREDDTIGLVKEKVKKQIAKDFAEENLSRKRQNRFVDLRPGDKLTDKNGYLLRQFIEANWEQVLEAYSVQHTAAKAYYGKVLEGAEHAAAIDIGWAGSGAMTLRHLVLQEWKISCKVVGIIAGTNTVHSAEPDASESFLQSGQLVSYLYSQGHNRDLLKKHDANKDYNVFWELLLASPTPQFKGFYEGQLRTEETYGISKNADEKHSGDYQYLKDLDITLAFGRYDANQQGIREIQRGILDFVMEYRKRFKDFPYMFQISGRDAYAPMLVAASHKEKYLKAIENRFSLEINVN